MYRKGEGTGSNLANRAMVEESMTLRAGLSRPEEQILFDPQTSGGLLLSVPEEEADDLMRALEAQGVAVAERVADVVAGPPSLDVV
jgi:selenide,water dikinase